MSECFFSSESLCSKTFFVSFSEFAGTWPFAEVDFGFLHISVEKLPCGQRTKKKPVSLFVEGTEKNEVLKSSSTEHQTKEANRYFLVKAGIHKRHLAANGKSHWKNKGCIAWKKTITN